MEDCIGTLTPNLLVHNYILQMKNTKENVKSKHRKYLQSIPIYGFFCVLLPTVQPNGTHALTKSILLVILYHLKNAYVFGHTPVR